MAPTITHLVLIAKPGLIGNSLLAYCRSLVCHHVQAESLAPQAYLQQAGQVAADVLLVLEEDNPRETDAVLHVASSTQQRTIIIVNDINRQRILRMETDQPVLLWGLINQSLAQYLFDQ